MGELIQTVDYDINLTLVTVVGTVTAQEIMSATEKYYKGTPTRFLLFDFQSADTSSLSADNLRTIAQNSKRTMHSRPDAKTAVVVKSDVEYGMGRMFETFMELEELPVSVNIFKDTESAMQWLLSDE